MTESRTAPMRAGRRSGLAGGLAGLLVALFVVAGLVAGYGLGHAPPLRICTEHAVSVPVAAVADAPGGPSAVGPPAAPDGASASSPTVRAGAAPAPVDSPRLPSGDACLCLAVLLTLLALGLTGGLRRPFLRLPARTGRTPVPPTGGVLAAPSLAALQVLRL